MTWKPLLEGGEAEAARTILERFFRRLEYPDHQDRGPSFANGASGVALFHAYYAATYPSEAASAAVERWLQHAIDRVARTPPRGGLFAGLAGLDWVLNHITGDVDPSTIELLVGVLPDIAPTWDLIDGSLGIALYALSIGEPAAFLLEAAVTAALDSLVSSGNSSFWQPAEALASGRRARYPRGCLDLGTAHGVPGAVAVLAQALGSGRLSERTSAHVERLVQEGTELLTDRLTEASSCAYPAIWDESGVAMRTQPMWCYGATGAACALLASRVTALEPLALRLASSACRDFQLSGPDIDDYGICHGCAGTAHSFNRLWQTTSDQEYRDHALLHVRYVLGNALRQGSHGGLHVTASKDLLSGAAGIGLVLLAAASSVTPVWDVLMLMSPLVQGEAAAR